MRERLFVIASQRWQGKIWWVVGEKAGPRSSKHEAIWTFRTRSEAMHLIETLGRLVEDLGRLPSPAARRNPKPSAPKAAEGRSGTPADR
jgi:hypothetical protein